METEVIFQSILGVLVGVGLSSAVGLRIFAPFFVMSIAAAGGVLPLAEGFEWIATTPALIAFGIAMLLEVGGYWIPWVDNALDALTAPVTMIAGVIATASVVTDLPPILQWTVAIIAGGGAASLLHGGTAVLRAGSTATTAGLANPLLATVELVASVVGSLLAIAVPVLALALFVLLVWWVRRKFRRRAEVIGA